MSRAMGKNMDAADTLETGRTLRAGRERQRLTAVVRWAFRISLAALIVAVLAIAGYFLYQWIYARNAQSELANQWEQVPIGVDLSSTIRPGDVVGVIRIPKIGLEAYLVELSNPEDRANLNRGPGHIQGTAWPGEVGNCVIAGHRVTYSHPFLHIDQIEPGDEIIIECPNYVSHYRMVESQIVTPDRVEVMDPTPDPMVTLIACHPPHTATYRYIVRGSLKSREDKRPTIPAP